MDHVETEPKPSLDEGTAIPSLLVDDSGDAKSDTDKEKQDVQITTVSDLSDEDAVVIDKAQDVSLQVLSTADDDPDMPAFTFRTYFLGLGLGAFAAVCSLFEDCLLNSTSSQVLSTIYTFKPQVCP